MLTTINYAPTAYRSDKLPPQPAAPAGYPPGMGAIIYKTATRLPWGHTQPVTLLSLIETGGPTQLAKVEKAFKKSGESLIDELDGALNHISIRPVSLSKGSAFLYYGAAIGKGMTIVSLFCGIIGILALYYGVGLTLGKIIKESIGYFIIALGIPLLLWIFCPLIMNYFPMAKGKGAKWELNRQTGMVTLYKPDKTTKERMAYTKPFYEFDAYLTRNPSQQGIIYYNLRLQHRYQDLAIEGFLDSSTGSQQPVLAAWDCIQNYMDTTQPLPDIGGLEMFRQYDPTTIAYDQKTKRNPRLRREMPLEKWLDYKQTLLAQIEAVNYSNRANIMAPYVDYSQLPLT